MEDLEDTKYLDEEYIPDVVPLDTREDYSNDEGDESVLEGSGKSNNDSLPTVHVYIT